MIDHETVSWITDDEANALVMNLAYSRKDEGFTEEEAQKVLDWAVETRIGNSLLDLILLNLVFININDQGEVVFRLNQEADENILTREG